MFQKTKNIITKTFLYDIIKYTFERKRLREWSKKGRCATLEHLVNQRVVKGYAKKFSIGILIEIGTYSGDMIDATENTFGKIISIEVNRTLYKSAEKKFSRFSHISVIQGASKDVLPDILSNITRPCLF